MGREPMGREPVGREPVQVSPDAIAILSAEVVRPGRPGLVSVIADVSGQVIHVVFGLRTPGDEVQFLADADDSPLGVIEDDEGLAVVFDATADSELMLLLIGAVAAVDGELERVRRVAVTGDTVSLTFDDRLVFTIFQELPRDGGPHAGLELFLGLDGVGFNHLLAPVAIWRRGGTDLGIVQAYEAGSSGGWSLALTSLRDLYAAGGSPERAGGDFAPEALHLGTMTARMHLGLDRAFGREAGDLGVWVAEVEHLVGLAGPDLLATDEVSALLDNLRSSNRPCAAIRTHGDFHLGRVSRTDLGWYVLDFSPGGISEFWAGTVPAGRGVFRSPLADVADMLWSFHHVSVVAAAERDPDGHLGLSELGQAWEMRNRKAFLDGYLATSGIDGLMPPGRDTVQELIAAFELVRAASTAALRP
ncbi:MAG: hypothetical protein ACYCV7_04505 [Acidimicrobiales bacterium]